MDRTEHMVIVAVMCSSGRFLMQKKPRPKSPKTAFSQKLFRRETSDVNLLSNTDTSFNELDLFSRVQTAPGSLK